MGMMINSGGRPGRRRRGRGGHAPMSEINVTPFVDVMLVLLIIFMVAAPLLVTGVPLDLPKAKGVPLEASNPEPVQISVDGSGQIYLGEQQNTPIELNELIPKLSAVARSRGGFEAKVRLRGHKDVAYGVVLRVLGRVQDAGFNKLQLLSLPEQDGS
jgi:biopolymer transport protein TolR